MNTCLLAMSPVGLTVLGLLAVTGCSTPVQTRNVIVYGRCPLPDDAQVIGLTVNRPCPEFSLDTPTTKSDGAKIAAAAGARDMGRDPQAAFLFPVGYVVGGLVGGLCGVSDGEIKAASSAIAAVARERCFVEELKSAIAQQVNAGRAGRLRIVADNLPAQRPEIEGHLERNADRKLVWHRSTAGAHPLAGTEYDAVIGIRVSQQGLQARPNPRVSSTGDFHTFNPPLAFSLIADIKVLRVSDWAELGGLTICYEGKTHKFTEWAADGGAPLRQEMTYAYAETLRQVRNQFSSTPSTPPPT